MGGYTLRSYRRVHKFEHAADVERGKVSRDTNASIKAAKKRERLSERLLADPLNDELLEQFEEAEHNAERKRRGAKTHKERLKKLEREGLE